ncbi:hypothetical protein [Nocardioides sp. Root140]|uniref:hypothetical protein n=1 Tax=Nocardioides sp. Root140 TaxID=1736460 RepID=UPI0007006ED2|nr:hypothetical protein [Nocardioides sp. Root140]KQY61437.1 hypothetical protein ASD30_25605 [Nocardioides sp. Root140]
MGWITDSGEHEGYVLPEFEDGQRGIGVSGGGVPHDQVIVGIDYVGKPGAITDERYLTRPAAEVIGWRVVCDCNTSGPAGSRQWVSDLVTRVPSPALENPNAGKIYAADDDVIDVIDTHEDALRNLWRRSHVGGFDALDEISKARERVENAQDELTAAVAAAREQSVSWEAIGRATGMTRQSAHSRWAPPVVS